MFIFLLVHKLFYVSSNKKLQAYKDEFSLSSNYHQLILNVVLKNACCFEGVISSTSNCRLCFPDANFTITPSPSGLLSVR